MGEVVFVDYRAEILEDKRQRLAFVQTRLGCEFLEAAVPVLGQSNRETAGEAKALGHLDLRDGMG